MAELSREPVILSACRTATGRFLGSLAEVPAHRLGSIVVAEAIRRAGLSPEDVQEVILGNVLQAGQGQNPARLASLAVGVPECTPAMTINKLCGSGMKAVHLAAQAVLCGDAEVVVAGGMENMSLAPYLLAKARTGYRVGHGILEDHLIRDGLSCGVLGYHMGVTAENVAAKYGISRQDQDAYALESQRRAAAAMAAGLFKEEVVPVPLPQKKGVPVLLDTEEQPGLTPPLRAWPNSSPPSKRTAR